MSLKRGDTGEEAPLLVGGRVCQTIVGGYIYVTHPHHKIIIKYMGDYLYMSFIIRTFILSMVKSETCSGGISFAEGRLQLALIYYYRSPILFFNTDLLE
jgi:hypothetical protein